MLLKSTRTVMSRVPLVTRGAMASSKMFYQAPIIAMRYPSVAAPVRNFAAKTDESDFDGHDDFGAKSKVGEDGDMNS